MVVVCLNINFLVFQKTSYFNSKGFCVPSLSNFLFNILSLLLIVNFQLKASEFVVEKKENKRSNVKLKEKLGEDLGEVISSISELISDLGGFISKFSNVQQRFMEDLRSLVEGNFSDKKELLNTEVEANKIKKNIKEFKEFLDNLQEKKLETKKSDSAV